jgi:hypothetical protein
MGENSKIQWTDHTAALLPEPFAALEFPGIPDAIRLEVLKFVARVAERHPVGNLIPKIGVRRERFDVVRPQITTAAIAAFGAAKGVPRENSKPPNKVFRSSAVVFAALGCSTLPCVVIFSARRSFQRHLRDALFRLSRVLLANPVAWPGLGRRAHFSASRIRHLLSLKRRNEGLSPPYPSEPHLFLGFFGVLCHGQ